MQQVLSCQLAQAEDAQKVDLQHRSLELCGLEQLTVLMSCLYIRPDLGGCNAQGSNVTNVKAAQLPSHWHCYSKAQPPCVMHMYAMPRCSWVVVPMRLRRK